MDPRRKAKRPKAMPQASMPRPRAADQTRARPDSGRGIGGLTLVLSLHQLGIPCIVFAAA
jgi:hypothetical protein